MIINEYDKFKVGDKVIVKGKPTDVYASARMDFEWWNSWNVNMYYVEMVMSELFRVELYKQYQDYINGERVLVTLTDPIFMMMMGEM